MGNERDNNYWRKRLIKDSHDELLAKVDAREISMYEATFKAGYRKKQRKQGLALIEAEWPKLSREDRMIFVARNLREMNEIMRRVGELVIEKKQVQKAKE